MELHLRIESVTVLRCQFLGVQHWVGLPTKTVPVITILLISTCLSVCPLRQTVLIRCSIKWISLLFRPQISRFPGTDPLIRLNKDLLTTQAGCDLWISVFPYLALDAFLDLSIKASLVMLNPVVASPLRLALISGLFRAYLVMFENVLACKLSALFLGMKPE